MNGDYHTQPSTADVNADQQLPINIEEGVVEQVQKQEDPNLVQKLQEELAHAQRQLVIAQRKNEMSVPANEIKTDIFDPAMWKQMKGMAETFALSGALPKDMNASKIVMTMQAGMEMGMKPIESIKSFYFVNGTMNIFGGAVSRRLREHGWRIQFDEKEDSCTATITKGDESYTDTLTYKEAEASKWTSSQYGLKPGWLPGANRKLKLRYGVLSMLIKTYIPEVLGSATDIAEVAMDASTAYMEPKQVIVDGGGEPADERTLGTLKQVGKYTDEEIQAMNLTQQDAVDKIKQLMTPKKRGGENHG